MTPEVRKVWHEAIEEMFDVPGIIGCWPRIKECWEEMGFKDDLSDSEKIEEYGYITDQLRKFIIKKRPDILGCGDDYQKMMAEIDDMVNKTAEKASSRKMLIYLKLKHEWIISLHQYVSFILSEIEEERDGTDE